MKRGPGFVNASVRKVTNARQVGMRMQRKCTGKHRHARVGANIASEKMEQSGTWVREVARALEKHVREDLQELKVCEKRRKQRIQRGDEGLFMRSTKSQGTNHVQDKNGKTHTSR